MGNELGDTGNAPRVTPQMPDEVIIGEQYYIFPETTVTVCCLTLRNGYCVVGQSACASRENFDAELGRQIARDDARQKIWALEGYLLRQHLAMQEAVAAHRRTVASPAYVGEEAPESVTITSSGGLVLPTSFVVDPRERFVRVASEHGVDPAEVVKLSYPVSLSPQQLTEHTETEGLRAEELMADDDGE